MVLIFGGAYQGKTAFAQRAFGLSPEEIYTCSENEQPSFSYKAIDSFHEFIFECAKSGTDPSEFIISHFDDIKGKIIIMDDVCSGLVPMGAVNRLYRKYAGKSMQLLMGYADEAYRVFCGIGERLK
ncbi:MAG: bifunctional adenosylcobinamide kinase/adenosylcobinamide-phosphate guanylyltransferase [Eubacteriaceae bacterium]|nr:bifunctional adenosylcobinamide kinase/adenosylcobinamide-phosphate guanylyltransferase [Eubacteriaceae bacterium]